MDKIKVKVKLDTGAAMPTRAHDTDSGWDIRALSVKIEYRTLTDTEWRELGNRMHPPRKSDWRVIIDTGVHLQPPPGWGFVGRPNSRNGKSWWRWAFSPGTIDQQYTGAIKVMLEPRHEWVSAYWAPKPGEVCGQIVLERIYDMELEQVDELEETARGSGGFGSTEKKMTVCAHLSFTSGGLPKCQLGAAIPECRKCKKYQPMN